MKQGRKMSMEPLTGLTKSEVEERKMRGEGGTKREPATRTTGQIFRDNIFTLFNFLNVTIAALLFAAGAYSNMLFITIVLLNVAIGIAQELKAKKLVDELSILNRPQATVLRDGAECIVETEDVVKDDVMVLESGKQILNDAEVISGLIEVNESLLTGESDAVVKREGDSLLSGSFVAAGKCFARVTHVGGENYAERLTSEVKQTKQAESELLGSMKKITRFTSFLILPLGILLYLEAAGLRQQGFETSVVSSAAALLGMLPKGLVLLISVSLAMGVIRLARMKILVQNIYSLETLAHVDVLCLDKTGTLTDGSMQVQKIYPCPGFPSQEAESLLDAYLQASPDNNATIQALRKAFETEHTETNAQAGCIPFSSVRKWGAVSLENTGTVFLGAPERIFRKLPPDAEKLMDEGCRLVAVGYCGEIWENEEALPQNILPLFLIALSDRIRNNAEETLRYFRREGVEIKVISGDHKRTAAATARRAGLAEWQNAVDMSELGETIDYDDICEKYTVFARVTPKQKQLLVRALKRRGHHVAMTGDGVNDLLALREADCSIAVSEGSDASRQISQIVLLDSDFANLPQVVLEGRKVINNVTRTAGVFFIKTIYSVLVSVFCLIFNVPFPFIPLQITLVDAFVEAYPSFITIFESDTRRPKGSFLRTAFGNALPFALAVGGAIVWVSLRVPFDAEQNRTVMYVLLILLSMLAVVKSCIPFTGFRAFICVTMAFGCFGALALLPSLFEVAPFTAAMAEYAAVAFCLCAALISIFFRTSGGISEGAPENI